MDRVGKRCRRVNISIMLLYRLETIFRPMYKKSPFFRVMCMTYGVIYYVHMREMGLCFYLLCFVGFTIRCTLLYNYFLSILH